MSQLSIQDVNSAIMFGDFTNDQLSSIASAIKFRRGQIVKETKLQSSSVVGKLLKKQNDRSCWAMLLNLYIPRLGAHIRAMLLKLQ